jgi:hypothetical protein
MYRRHQGPYARKVLDKGIVGAKTETSLASIVLKILVYN